MRLEAEPKLQYLGGDGGYRKHRAEVVRAIEVGARARKVAGLEPGLRPYEVQSERASRLRSAKDPARGEVLAAGPVTGAGLESGLVEKDLGEVGGQGLEVVAHRRGAFHYGWPAPRAATARHSCGGL